MDKDECASTFGKFSTLDVHKNVLFLWVTLTLISPFYLFYRLSIVSFLSILFNVLTKPRGKYKTRLVKK